MTPTKGRNLDRVTLPPAALVSCAEGVPGKEPSEMNVSCQFSLYPLRQEKLGEVLGEALRELDQIGVSYRVGSMGTEMEGEEEDVFSALRSTFRRVAEHGDAVLVATISNACGG